jgi:hypothetical protein
MPNRSLTVIELLKHHSSSSKCITYSKSIQIQTLLMLMLLFNNWFNASTLNIPFVCNV